MAQKKSVAQAFSKGAHAFAQPVGFTVGDPSDSNTGRWEMRIYETATGKNIYNHCDEGFGTPGTKE